MEASYKYIEEKKFRPVTLTVEIKNEEELLDLYHRLEARDVIDVQLMDGREFSLPKNHSYPLRRKLRTIIIESGLKEITPVNYEDPIGW